MRILTEQELRCVVDGTVRRTLAENSQDEGIGKWLLGGAAGLIGLRYLPQIKNFFSGLFDGGSSSSDPITRTKYTTEYSTEHSTEW